MQIILEQRRLQLLKTLFEIDERRLNSRVLTNVIHSSGLPGTQADIESDLAFLQTAGCVVLETLGEFTIAELIERGENVATGALRIAGVQRARARG